MVSRAYSIGNAPREDGGIEIQIRKVEGGRFSNWSFEKMEVGDVIKVRGPLGNFTLSSDRETPLLFVAGGTGFAPIKSIIEQVLKISDTRVITLVWGNHTSDGFYELDVLESWCNMNPNFRCLIATHNIRSGFRPGDKCNLINKSLVDAIKEVDIDGDSSAFDAYVAGPTEMLQPVIGSLINKVIAREHIKVDSFGG